jgi:hypothetical protein
MQLDDSKSGNHLERWPDERQAVVANIPERHGVTGHHVRTILFIGTAGAVAAFAILLIIFFG